MSEKVQSFVAATSLVVAVIVVVVVVLAATVTVGFGYWVATPCLG